MTDNQDMTNAQDLRNEANVMDAAAEESFQRCDTDGFLSQWALGLGAQERRAQAAILEAGGVSEFAALFDLDGNRVPAKLIDGRFGLCWAICDEAGKFTGEFVNAFPKREATMARKGYREGREMAPARARIVGSGTGLSGAASCHVMTVRTDGGYPGCPSWE